MSEIKHTRYEEHSQPAMVDMRFQTELQQSGGSSKWIAAAMVIALIGAGVTAAYYLSGKPHDVLAMAPGAQQPGAGGQSGMTPAPSAVPTAQDAPVTQPLDPLTKAKEENAMPLAGHGNNHSSPALDPVKAKQAAAAQSKALAKDAPATKPAAAPAPAVTPQKQEPTATPLVREPDTPRTDASPARTETTPAPPPAADAPQPKQTVET